MLYVPGSTALVAVRFVASRVPSPRGSETSGVIMVQLTSQRLRNGRIWTLHSHYLEVTDAVCGNRDSMELA